MSRVRARLARYTDTSTCRRKLAGEAVNAHRSSRPGVRACDAVLTCFCCSARSCLILSRIALKAIIQIGAYIFSCGARQFTVRGELTADWRSFACFTCCAYRDGHGCRKRACLAGEAGVCCNGTLSSRELACITVGTYIDACLRRVRADGTVCADRSSSRRVLAGEAVNAHGSSGRRILAGTTM